MIVRRLPGLMLAGIVLLLVAQTVPAAEKSPFAGDWQGTLKLPQGVELRLIFHVTEGKPAALTATMESPDQGAGALPVETVTAKDSTITLDLPKIRGKFSGKLDAKGETIVGDWSQNGRSLPLTIARVDPSKLKALVVPAVLEGVWEGNIEAGAGTKLRLVLKVTKGKNGTLVAVFRSPDQVDQDFPLTAISLEGDALTAEAKILASTYTGKLNAAKTEIVGQWKQGGAQLPLTLKKTEQETKVKRPQTPKPPFSYESVDVRYPNPAGKLELAGTLTKPKGPGPFPVAIMITGSGQQDRDETLFQHKPFAVIADHLTKRGVAVLRVDDRGVGGSTGDAAKATSEDFATDVLAGIRYLKSRKDIDPKRIGLIGHSEGGLIAPIVAAKHPEDVDFIVLLAGPGLDGAKIIQLQGALIAKAMGASAESISRQARLLDDVIAISNTESDQKVAAQKITEATKKIVATMSKEEKAAFAEAEGIAQSRLAMFSTPWFRYFLKHDPRGPLKQVKCPVLALNGEKDLQVPPKENLEAITKALDEGGNSRYVAKALPHLNHLFQTSKTGSPSEYGTIEESVAPAALELISDWVVTTTGAKTP